MSGVFLSYSRADRPVAARVVFALRQLGAIVWWDEDMEGGVSWQRELEKKIEELHSVVVLWTPNSVNSDYVGDEARLALSANKLINITVGARKPPFPYDRVNALPLDGWTGREPHSGWARVVQAVERRMIESGAAAQGVLTGALAVLEAEARKARTALGVAEAAFREATARDAAAREADAEARTALKQADDQLRQLSGLGGGVSTKVLRAAQGDYDDCRATRTETEAERKAAASALAAAARALTLAKADVAQLFDDPADPERSVGPHAPPQHTRIVERTTRSVTSKPDANLMYDAGCQYRDGRGVPQDYVQAMSWFRYAADFGHPAAQCNVGYLYGNGLGVKQDYAEAMAWYRKAADQGDAAAQYSIGVLYFYGRGVPQDHAESMVWYRKAADQGYAPAQYKIGSFYGDGLVVAQDHAEAMKWYAKAAEQGDSTAEYGIGVLYFRGLGVAQDYGQAMHWFRRAAEQDVAVALYGVAYLYSAGLGVAKDLTQARIWYLKAAAAGSQDAKDWLASHPG